jgi:hypothetical protein
MDSLFQALEWLFIAGQALSCLCLIYGAYISLRYLSMPFIEEATARAAPLSLPGIAKPPHSAG